MKHTLIPACDLNAKTFRELVQATHELSGISAFKVGFQLALEIGLPATVKIVREFSCKSVIYDHQKAGSDIPDTAAPFMDVCANAGIDAVILFPTSGPKVLTAWVEAAQAAKLKVMVGGLMTHPSYLVSEGGFIADEAAPLIYIMAADLGVTDFIVPATKLDFSWSIYDSLRSRGVEPTFYSPGIGTQGGQWSDLIRPMGPAWHAIVGRSLLKDAKYKTNAERLLQEIPKV